MGQVCPPQDLALLLHEFVFLLHVLTTSSSSFSAFSRTCLAYIRVTEPPVSKQLNMLLLCVDDRVRQYYYEVERPGDSMNNALESLRALFEGESARSG